MKPFLPSDLDIFERERAREFVRLVQARCARAATDERGADRWLTALGDGAGRISRLSKSGLPAATTTDSSYAGDIISDYKVVVGAFSQSLRTQSFFFDLLQPGGFVRIPMRTRAGVITLGATGHSVNEGTPKPITRVSVEHQEIQPRKAVALLVATSELITALGESGLLLFENELRNAVAQTVDEIAVAVLLEDVTPAASSGATFANAIEDLQTLLGAVEVRGGRLALLASPDVALAASLLATTGGMAFPGMTVSGGTLAGVTVYVSDGVPPQTLVAVNLGFVGADADTFDVAVSRQAAIEMLDAALVQNATTSVGANLLSLWQTNSVGLKVETSFGLEVLKAGGVSAVENIEWGTAAP